MTQRSQRRAISVVLIVISCRPTSRRVRSGHVGDRLTRRCGRVDISVHTAVAGVDLRTAIQHVGASLPEQVIHTRRPQQPGTIGMMTRHIDRNAQVLEFPEESSPFWDQFMDLLERLAYRNGPRFPETYRCV